MEHETYNQAYFDGHQIRGVLTLSNRALIRFMDRTLDRLKAPRQTALEIGCAYGAFTKAVSHIVPRITGVDISQHAISEGRKRYPDLELLQLDLDMGNLPPAFEGAFDVIVSLHTFEHFHNPESAIEKTVRAMTPGGTLFLVVPNPKIWMGKLLGLVGKKKAIPVFGDETHVSLYTQQQWLEILVKKGLKVATFGRPFFVIKHPLLDRIYHDKYYTKYLQQSGFELLFVCQKH